MYVFVFTSPPTARVILKLGHVLKVSSDRLEDPSIEPQTPGYKASMFIHYAMVAPQLSDTISCCSMVKVLPAGGVAELVSGSVTLTTGECCSRNNFPAGGVAELVSGSVTVTTGEYCSCDN